jgi:hypothetical protein
VQQAEALQLQKLVEELDGVISAKLNLNAAGELEEIHVLSQKDRNPKQLSRDIQSALSAATGGNIEHRIISIARVSGPMKNDLRLLFSGISLSLSTTSFAATVTLTSEDKTFQGVGRDGPAAATRTLTVAKACVDAVHQYLHREVFSVCEVQKNRIVGREALTVAVSYRSHDWEKLLAGTAVIGADEYDAAVRATLDAVNRVLPQISG